MDLMRSGNSAEDNLGIPDDLRCKRSDGKQWRCTAMSMPDKTVCEKHYIQAKKRAANSAMRASLKKAKRKSMCENEVYLESKSDDYDVPLASMKTEEYPLPVSGKKYSERASKTETPSARTFSQRNPPNLNDDSQLDLEEYEEDWRSYKTPPASGMESSMSRPQRDLDATAMTASEYSDQSTESSEETESAGQTCHQCRRTDRDSVYWCLKCDRRGYCHDCISLWYPDISLEDIQRVCPACRGTCNCKVCLRGDNLLKVRIKEIPTLDKLLYLHCLLSSVLPVVKQIHHEQCFEVELEKRLRGAEVDLARTRLNADEQMCCNFCRIPIIDYHRHCASCSYDLCLSCSRDLREASDELNGKSQEKENSIDQPKALRFKLNFSEKFPDWKANADGSIPCPPKEYGGCSYSSSLNLSRIFKMNWVAKLVKNVEEMVSGCRVYGGASCPEDGGDNLLYCPSSEELKSGGTRDFRKHWARGEPVIVKEVFDGSSTSSWDPMAIWKGIRETMNGKSKVDTEIVKAVHCYDWTEVDIELDRFIKGYFDDRAQPEMMLKLKDWPSPRASEEFLLYQRPEFISKLPLLEYIHSKWGLLNVAAKLPHYSLQNDVGPKIFISYGSYEESGDNCVTNLHVNTRDMVYLLVHTCEAKSYDQQETEIIEEPEEKDSRGDEKFGQETLDENKDEMMTDQGVDFCSNVPAKSNQDGENVSEKTRPGATWDVFRRQDVPNVVKYLRIHGAEFTDLPNDDRDEFVTRPLFGERFFLTGRHKQLLKEEFGVEPWSFEQNLGQAVFVPAGCPYQVRNLQSTVQLGLDFLSPESLGEAVKLVEEIRCFPNDHEAKLQVLEVGKISLYAASSAIKEVQKLVLDTKLGAELGFEDLNLTGAVSENLEKMTKRRPITCP